MVVPEGGAEAEAVTVADVVGRAVLGGGEDGRVLGLVRVGAAEAGTADEGATGLAGAALARAQLGGVAGTVAMMVAGDRVVGSGEDCAAGESGPPPEVTAG
jgi:hypothetical protein